MYLLIEVRLNILLKCHGSYIRVRKLNHMFGNDILGNYSKYLRCPEEGFLMVWVRK